MERTYWHKQTPSKPLFPELEWSQPENKLHAGKLLIIGGNAQGFAAPAEAYAQAQTAGIGMARVLLPDSLQKTVGKLFPAAEFAPSNPSGGFAQASLAEVLAQAAWADGVLMAGDAGRNSETAIVLENFLAKSTGQVTITKDTVDYFTTTPQSVLGRPNTTLVLSFAQLQKLATNAHFSAPFTFNMDLLRLVDTLHQFTTIHSLHLITKHLDTVFVATNGEVSSTKLNHPHEIWRVHTAATASVWWLQNPAKPFQALTTAVSLLNR